VLAEIAGDPSGFGEDCREFLTAIACEVLYRLDGEKGPLG
jgi:hypothetical protein